METKFTKGKWETNNDYVWSGIVQICDIYEIDKENKDIEAMANAKLIAAAPELLEALLNIENDDNSIPKAIWDLRNAAIQKAVGSDFLAYGVTIRLKFRRGLLLRL